MIHYPRSSPAAGTLLQRSLVAKHDFCNVFIRGIPLRVKAYELETAISDVLHAASLCDVSSEQTILRPINFDLNVFRAKQGRSSRIGTLFIPDSSIAIAFLLRTEEYPIVVDATTIIIERDTQRSATAQQIAALLSEAYNGKEAAQQLWQADQVPALANMSLKLGHKSRVGALGARAEASKQALLCIFMHRPAS